MKVKSESEVAQSCPTLCDPMDCSPPGSSAHGIFQARVLEWVAIAFSIISYTPIQIKKLKKITIKLKVQKIVISIVYDISKDIAIMYLYKLYVNRASQVASGVKNPPANAGAVRDAVSIPGSGRSLEEGTATHSSILARRIPGTEELGRLQSIGSHRLGHNRSDRVAKIQTPLK